MMNWDAIGAVGEVIGAAAVVVSVIYLSFQVRHNTAATQRISHQEHFNAAQDFNSLIAQNRDFAELIVKSNDDNESLTAADRLQLQHHYINLFTLWYSAYHDRQQGILDDSDWHLWDVGLKTLLKAQRPLRDTWLAAGHCYGPEFGAHVESAFDEVGELTSTSGVFGRLGEKNAG